ncbi:hypothetical protein GGI15_001808 [Coemansia interrupta]|uniref:Uncharacterized protein n=1 Tax=Coemansia interrupta TaxID=1126814 RepID=A0A9W8LMZ2_9FUNG|nr:hypothetical protein GGI15_001808 [Coemansia interrupta]
MGNGMYCDVETYRQEHSAEELLYINSRKTLDYLKTAHSRLVLLMKQLNFYKRNPLCGAMCKEVETKIYQQSLLLRRHHQQLNDMVEDYNRMSESSSDSSSQTELSTPHSSQADWEEVIEMAKRPVETMFRRPQSKSSSHGDSIFKCIYQSPLSGTTATGSMEQQQQGTQADAQPQMRSSQKTFPMQMTPPMEEVVELRERLRVLERSPLFTAVPAVAPTSAAAKNLHVHLSMLSTGQRSPFSLP